MTVTQLRTYLEELEKRGRGDDEIVPTDFEHNWYSWADVSKVWFEDYKALFYEGDGFIEIRFE